MTLNTQSLNLNARQILFKRLSTAQAIAYTGPLGEVIIDANLKLLRVQDGVTAGGHLMITSNVTANLQAQIDSIKSNLDPAAIDSLTEIMANVTALLANNAESQLVNSGFYANLTTTGNLVLDGSLLPKTHVAQDLGSATRSWRNLYISNATAYFGNAALTVTNNGLQVFNSNNQLMPLIGNVRFPDGTIQSTAVDQKIVANIFYLLTPNVSANLNTIHTDVTNAISYFSNLANAAVTTVQANLQSQIDFIKTNIDPAALDSLTEIVASFQNIDANIVSNIGTLGNIVGNLVATKDRLTSGNVQMLLTAGAQPSVQFPVGPTGQIIISEAEITALSGNLSLSSMGDAYILSNGDGAAPGAGKLWKFDRSGNLTLPRGSLKRDVINGFLTVEGPLDADFVAGSGGGINTISNGVKIRTHRVTDDANHDWDFAWDGAVYPPYDSASSQVGAIEWRKSGNVSSQIKYTLGSTVNNIVIPPGLIVNNYAGAGGFTIKADSGAGGSGASKYWTFNPDGSMTTPGLLKSGNIQVGTNIYGSAFYGISNAIQLRPNIDIDKRFLFTVDSSGGNYIRSGMEMPMAEVDKAVTLGFPHDNSTSGYIFNQGTDTNGTEWNDALVIFQNGGNVKIGTITNSNGTKIWEFNQTGTLRLPNSAVIRDSATNSISFGLRAGDSGQGNLTVAIGSQAGEINQGLQSTAVGSYAGNYNQGIGTVAIGTNAGALNQGLRAVAIGGLAGAQNQGEYAVALGNFAGGTNQPNNSIIINASGVALNGSASGLFIDPIREDTGNIAKVVYYNISTKELTYADLGAAATVDITNTNGLTTTYYPTFVENRTSGQTIRADVDLTYRTDSNLLKSGNIQVGRNIYGSPLGGISDAIQLRPNISIDKRFLFTVDSISGTYIRSSMEMPVAEVDKAVTLGFPHTNGTVSYIYNQGADTNGTEWNDALVIFQNGGNVKIGTITNSNGTKIWEFNQTGNLTLPQTNMNASPAPISLPGITFTDGTFQTTAYTGAAATVNILNTNGLSNTFYPTFVEFRTTGQYVRADVDFTYRSDSNTLTVPKISGMLQGNVDHAGGYINFTGSPAPGTSGITFADGTTQTTAWTRAAAAVQSVPPASPVTGQLYYDTDDGNTYIWTGAAWVDSNPAVGPSPVIANPTFTGTSKMSGVHESFTSLSNATGVVTHDCTNNQIFRHTTPSANWTANFANLNLASGYATAITLVIVQGATAYYANSVQIGGAAQTINWSGNTLPTANANRIDTLTFSVLNNSGTYTVLGQLSGF